MKTLIALAVMMMVGTVAQAIDMDALAMIESSNNPKAYNERTKATGLYQITPICLQHYNEVHKSDYTMRALYNEELNLAVASWYLGWLGRRGFTTDEVLAGYNWGYGNVKRHGLGNLPKETRDYLVKYHKMTEV